MLRLRIVLDLDTKTHTYPGPALANWAHYSAIPAFSTNSLRRRRCYKPIPPNATDHLAMSTYWRTPSVTVSD